MTTATLTAYDELKSLLRESATLGSVGSLLNWDQETQMPPKGGAFRGEQASLIARLAHERLTDPRVGELLGACEADPELNADAAIKANLREIRRDYDKATKLPSELVTEMSLTFAHGVEAWRVARAKSDFSAMKPWYEKVVALNRRKAECLGAPKGGELYDALLDEFEPGMTSAEIEVIFKPLRERLTPLIAAIAGSGVKPDLSVHDVPSPLPEQIKFVEFVARSVGYDFEAGRLDISTHPFSETIGIGDSRITSRFTDSHVVEPVATTLHEAGHGMYEQGLPRSAHFGTPLAEACSLGIHESQSRMWENQVGRSRPFWSWLTPHMKRMLGSGFDRFGVDQVYASVNAVKPHFIRVESDEATYNLHIMLRFDIERALIRGDLRVDDLPGVWNERMKSDLGLTVPEDRLGVLQDIHWPMGAIGYFPTYTLGNLYAAQFWVKINEVFPDLDGMMGRGEFSPLLAWLRENIHSQGRRYPAPELCQRITGKGLSHEPLCDYLEAKFRPLYGL
ncbi:MAG: carboxypeptidase M32 [Phycisphaeraceae bacterium]|nr:carboxypeptidase M32 [Phycisphaeraceae bacterium]MCB9847015.1 carboxypeptidase M32 [Phycisphaeraceae bacterium]